MKQSMTTPTDVRKRAIEIIRQLPLEKLTDAIHFLEFLLKIEQEATSSAEEAVLIEII